MLELDRDLLYKEYIENRLSMNKLADKYNCCPMAIWSKLKKYEINSRTRSEANRGKFHPFYGKKHTKETKEKISITNKQKGLKPPVGLSPFHLHKNYNEIYGKKRAKKIKEKISKSNTGKKRSLETCKKLSKHRLTRIFPKTKTKIELKIEKELVKLNIPYEMNFPIIEARTQVDFFILPNIVIYCDGDYWHNLPEAIEKDKRQNKKLKELGFKVLRFWEHEIKLNIKNCKEKIKEIYYGI